MVWSKRQRQIGAPKTRRAASRSRLAKTAYATDPDQIYANE
jgi:hypothetical protein